MRAAAMFSLVLLAACGSAPTKGSVGSHGSATSGSSGTSSAHLAGGGTGAGSTSSTSTTSTSGSGSTTSSTSSTSSASSSSSGSTSTGASSGSTGAPSSSSSSGSTSTSSGSGSTSSTTTSGGTTTTGSSTTGSAGAALGQPCSAGADCASGTCLPVLYGGGKVCVSSCTSQADCDAAAPGFFCDPISAGDTNGFCVPPSAAHCASCSTDADCGVLSEACALAPGDAAPACHVDCSLGGASACPGDYVCSSVTVNGTARQLCVPSSGGCEGALGGFCDRVPGPIPCSEVAADGTCTGQRSCDSSTFRFGACNAGTPTCRQSCATPMDPGCTEVLCPSATSGPDNCGTCGNVCPGSGQSTAVVTCTAGACGFTCAGANYDSNANPADGCEQPDTPDDHTQSTATELGNSDCYDGDGIPPGGGGPSGNIASDTRAHVPAINGFASSVGAAPDWFHTFNTGGSFCQDDFSVTLTVQGSSYPSCYKLSVVTSNGTWAQNTDATGRTTISSGSGSYSDGSDIYLVAEKVCSTAQIEAVSYTITGHF